MVSFSPQGTTLIAYFPPRADPGPFTPLSHATSSTTTMAGGLEGGSGTFGRLCIWTQAPNRALNDWVLSQHFVCGVGVGGMEEEAVLQAQHTHQGGPGQQGDAAGTGATGFGQGRARLGALATLAFALQVQQQLPHGADQQAVLDMLSDEPVEIKWLGIGRQVGSLVEIPWFVLMRRMLKSSCLLLAFAADQPEGCKH
jgi:hypothetical protein